MHVAGNGDDSTCRGQKRPQRSEIPDWRSFGKMLDVACMDPVGNDVELSLPNEDQEPVVITVWNA